MGMSHAREDDTYPRLAVPLGWASPEHLLDVIEAVDHRAARLGPPRRPPAGPPQVHDRGARHRARSAPRSAAAPASRSPPLAEQAPWSDEDYHGTRDGVVGLPVPSGKVADRDGVELRTAMRALVDRRARSRRSPSPAARTSCCTASATAAPTSSRTACARHGVKLAGDVSALRRLSIACPALPTCGQALGEAERVLPDLVTELEKALADSGNGDAAIRLNMTGCPNGCARPYNSEIGIVGRTKKGYDLYVGGSAAGDRMGQRIRTDVPLDQIAATLAPVFAAVRRRAPTRPPRSATGRTASAPRRSPRGCPSRVVAAPGPAPPHRPRTS